VRPHLVALRVLLAGIMALVACGGQERVTGIGVSWPADPRLQTLRANLHTSGSGDEAHRLFPDLTEVYVDNAHGTSQPAGILPFRYYWSPSHRFTVSICAVGKTIFICPYYLSSRITHVDFGRCEVDPSYVTFEVKPPR